MTLRPCACGQTPIIAESERHRIQILRVECKCGAHGATLLFTEREDREKMKQAAADGWNLG